MGGGFAGRGIVAIYLLSSFIGLRAESKIELAKAWAPTFFHDQDAAYVESDTGFNPVDTIMGIDFDGNPDLSDNAVNLYNLSRSAKEHLLQRTPIYFSLVETETHFYINYMVYHPVDYNFLGHIHDTENVWMVIQKDGTPSGKFVAAISNAHGYGMIYSDDLKLQNDWRAKLPEDFRVKFLPFLDRYSSGHNNSAAVQFHERKQTQSKSLLLFIASKSHAIYKFNSEAWNKKGVIYFPEDCDDCETELATVTHSRKYSLEEWDAQKENLTDGFKPFYLTSFKTDNELFDPIAMHKFFAPANEKNLISSHYVTNPLADARKPISPRRRLEQALANLRFALLP